MQSVHRAVQGATLTAEIKWNEVVYRLADKTGGGVGQAGGWCLWSDKAAVVGLGSAALTRPVSAVSGSHTVHRAGAS